MEVVNDDHDLEQAAGLVIGGIEIDRVSELATLPMDVMATFSEAVGVPCARPSPQWFDTTWCLAGTRHCTYGTFRLARASRR